MGPVRATALVFFCFAPLFAASADEPRFIALAAEPIRNETVIPAVHAADAASVLTALHDAVAANNLPQFRAALDRARDIADSMPLGDARNDLRRDILTFEDVATIWSFSATDRFGAFYDDDALPGFHAKLSGDYAGYAKAITDAQVVDANGTVWYPTSETRAFLLKQLHAAKATPAAPAKPPVRVARHTRRARRAHAPEATFAFGAPGVAAVAEELKNVVPAQTLPEPHDALANDIRNAAKPPVAAPAPVQAEASGNGGGTLLFVILGLLMAGIISVFVRTPSAEEPVEHHEEPVPHHEAEIYDIKQPRAS